MKAIQLELLQLFFGVFSAHCNLSHTNEEHFHACPQISTMLNRKESVITPINETET